MERMHASLLSLACALGLALPLCAGQLWIVDDTPGPGVDFQDLPSAVAAAQDGDVLLVKDGNYAGFTLSAKSLTLVGDHAYSSGQASPGALLGPCTIEGLGAGQQFAFVHLKPRAEGGLPALRVRHCAGSVLIDHVVCGAGKPALSAEDTAGLIVARSYFGSEYPLGHAASIVCQGSALWVYDTYSIGGFGTDGAPAPSFAAPGAGYAGVLAEDGYVFANNCVFYGGAGGTAVFSNGQCFAGGTGGAGLQLGSGGPLLELRGTYFDGGYGGLASASCPIGAFGPPLLLESGQLASQPAPLRRFGFDRPAAREGQLAHVEAAGQQGHFVIAAYAPGFAQSLLPELGLLLPGAPLQLVPLGTLTGSFPAPAQLSVPLQLQELGPGVTHALYSAQGVFIDPLKLTVGLGSPALLLALDSAL